MVPILNVTEALASPAIFKASVTRNPLPEERARPSDATSPELSHGICIQPGSSLWRSSLGTSPKSGRLVKHLVDDRPEFATTRSNLGRLLSWRYARRPIWMWPSQRALPNPGELSELPQIFNSTNSAGPLSKCDLSIMDQNSQKILFRSVTQEMTYSNFNAIFEFLDNLL